MAGLIIFAQRASALLGSTATRGLVTSAASLSSNTPTYTYASPGSSMTEPGDHYLNEASSSSSDEKHGVTAMDEPTNRVKPSKKASMLKVLSTPRRKLTVQGAGVQMLPPGCSVSDPSYSIKDPVYFTDVEK